MSLSNFALVDLTQAKAHLRIDAAASLHAYAEYVGVGDDVETEFDLDNTPVDGSLRLYVDGTLQVETTDYSISVATITFVSAPAAPKPITASYDFAADDDTFESYDDDLLENLINAATKKAEDYTGRAWIQGSITETHFGDGSNVLRLRKWPVVSITSVVRSYSEVIGSGNGSTIAFALSEVPTASSLTVYKDGVAQTVTTHYTLSGSTVTFVAAPASGEEITVKYTHTIKPISEYTEWLGQGRLIGEVEWTKDKPFKIVYTAGYAATRAATQALVPDAVAAVLLMVSYLYENRTDLLKSENIAGLGAVAYDTVDKSGARQYLDLMRVIAW